MFANACKNSAGVAADALVIANVMDGQLRTGGHIINPEMLTLMQEIFPLR